MSRASTLLISSTAALVLAACGGGGKSYDIGPIFPVSDPAEKCAKYNGELKGSGPSASCMVSKADCERAAADWRDAMKNIPNAVDFRCT